MKIWMFIRQASFAKFIMADIYYALRRHGYDVRYEDLEQFVAERQCLPENERRKAIDGLLDAIDNYNPDLVLSYGMEYCANPFQKLIPEYNVPFYEILNKPAVFFLFDFGYPFVSEQMDAYREKLFSDLQKPDYLFFCWDKAAINRMKAFGLNKTFYFPMAVNEETFYKQKDALNPQDRLNANLLFVGGPTQARIKHLEAVSDLGLKVYGYGREQWEKSGLKDCYCGELNKRAALRDCYNHFRISVNITRAHGPTSLNMRVYEAMACGSLMLTDDTSDATRLFQADKEIVVYRSIQELRQKARILLRRDAHRKKIAEAGREKVLQEHTYFERMKTTLPIISQFIKEIAIFRRLSQLAEREPRHALELSTFKDTESFILYNRDNYYYLKACLFKATDRFNEIDNMLNLALKENRSHLASRRLQTALHEYAGESAVGP